MSFILYIGIIVAAFMIMEGISWITHRYLMHGILWTLHKDHHIKGPGFFERNDAFFLIFAVPSFLFILIGSLKGIYWLQALGFGIMAYGFAYFLVHEVIIHQRFKWFTRTNNTYIRAIRWAHKMHHKHIGKEDGESFGMLIVNKKYWEKIKKDKSYPRKNL